MRYRVLLATLAVAILLPIAVLQSAVAQGVRSDRDGSCLDGVCTLRKYLCRGDLNATLYQVTNWAASNVNYWCRNPDNQVATGTMTMEGWGNGTIVCCGHLSLDLPGRGGWHAAPCDASNPSRLTKVKLSGDVRRVWVDVKC